MTRSTLLNRNNPTLLFIKRRRSRDATGDLLSQNFAIFRRKHIVEEGLDQEETPTQMLGNIGEFLKKLF